MSDCDFMTEVGKPETWQQQISQAKSELRKCSIWRSVSVLAITVTADRHMENILNPATFLFCTVHELSEGQPVPSTAFLMQVILLTSPWYLKLHNAPHGFTYTNHSLHYIYIQVLQIVHTVFIIYH
jgi:hypothetical protein